MEKKQPYSFQVDSDIVKTVYENQDNFLIEYSDDVPKEYCIIYFTGNDLYFPNTEAAFRRRLIEKNHFEWYKTRIKRGYKHIFVRDVQKQFYLAGISSKINTSQKLVEFLKQETSGYRVITLGSSAGGFAAISYGQLLNAERIVSFNGTFEIRSKLNNSTELINPLIFRNQENREYNWWFDTRNLISDASTIFYFQSIKSAYDVRQFNHVKDLPINRIQFINSKHGIPFLKGNLPFVLNATSAELHQLTSHKIHPIVFSIKTIGLLKTFQSIFSIFKSGIKRIVNPANTRNK